jgi:hypothetical protein
MSYHIFLVANFTITMIHCHSHSHVADKQPFERPRASLVKQRDASHNGGMAYGHNKCLRGYRRTLRTRVVMERNLQRLKSAHRVKRTRGRWVRARKSGAALRRMRRQRCGRGDDAVVRLSVDRAPSRNQWRSELQIQFCATARRALPLIKRHSTAAPAAMGSPSRQRRQRRWGRQSGHVEPRST